MRKSVCLCSYTAEIWLRKRIRCRWKKGYSMNEVNDRYDMGVMDSCGTYYIKIFDRKTNTKLLYTLDGRMYSSTSDDKRLTASVTEHVNKNIECFQYMAKERELQRNSMKKSVAAGFAKIAGTETFKKYLDTAWEDDLKNMERFVQKILSMEK